MSNRILFDDPRLTAYALGELDPTERETVERLLAESPSAQAAVREIRELAGLLATELRREPVGALTDKQRAAIIGAAEGAAASAKQAAVPISLVPDKSSIAPSRARRATTRTPLTAPRLKRFASLVSLAALLVIAALLVPPPGQSSRSLPSAPPDRIFAFTTPLGAAGIERQRRIDELEMLQNEISQTLRSNNDFLENVLKKVQSEGSLSQADRQKVLFESLKALRKDRAQLALKLMKARVRLRAGDDGAIEELKTAQNHLDQLTAALKPAVAEKLLTQIGAQRRDAGAELRETVHLTEATLKRFDDEIDKFQFEVERVGLSGYEVEALREDLQQYEKLFDVIAEEKVRLTLEQAAPAPTVAGIPSVRSFGNSIALGKAAPRGEVSVDGRYQQLADGIL